MKYEGKREPYEWEVIYDEKPYILFLIDLMTITHMVFGLETATE